MANPEHVRKLCEGPGAWNAWREANPTVVPDLADASLSLSQRQFGPSNGGPINLRGANLEGTMLRFATLTASDLEGARFTGADLMHARLDRANLASADLTDAMLDHTDLTGTRLDGATIVGATLQNARNLRQPQIDAAHGDASTLLPLGLVAPPAWFPATTPDEFLGCPIPEEVREEEEYSDPYRLLGVKPTADPVEIREAYRRLVKQLHPDLNPGNREAAIKFGRVNDAYNLLKTGSTGDETAAQAAKSASAARARGRYEVAAMIALFLAIGGGVFYWLESAPDDEPVFSTQNEAPKPAPKPVTAANEATPPVSETAQADVSTETVKETAALSPQVTAPQETEAPAQVQTPPQAEARVEPQPQSEPAVAPAKSEAAAPQAPASAPASAVAMAPVQPTVDTQPEKPSPPSAKAGSELLSVHAEPDHVGTSSITPSASSSVAEPEAAPAQKPVKVAALTKEWHRMRESRDLAALYGFVQRHPDQPEATEARDRFHAVLGSLRNQAELAKFLKKHEDGTDPEITAAKERLTMLSQDASQKGEAPAWQSATKKNSREGYEGYLRSYPDGAHAADAKGKIAEIREAYHRRDDAAWAKTTSVNTREAYAAYLAAYPRGYHVKEAQHKLGGGRSQPQTQAQAQARGTQTRGAQKKPGVLDQFLGTE